MRGAGRLQEHDDLWWTLLHLLRRYCHFIVNHSALQRFLIKVGETGLGRHLTLELKALLRPRDAHL